MDSHAPILHDRCYELCHMTCDAVLQPPEACLPSRYSCTSLVSFSTIQYSTVRVLSLLYQSVTWRGNLNVFFSVGRRAFNSAR